MIVWIDLETTGLDERIGHMLEIAVVLTTDDLVEIAHVERLVRPPWLDGIVRQLDPVVREMHEKSGLLQAFEQLEPGNTVGDVEAAIGEWLMDASAEHWDVPTPSFHLVANPVAAPSTQPVSAEVIATALKETPIAGSTVGFDRRWLRRHMPTLEARFSYRSIDVSSLTELARRWAPAIYEGRPKAAKAHRALADVRESIEYLRYYRERGFVGGGGIHLTESEAALLRGALENTYFGRAADTEDDRRFDMLLAKLGVTGGRGR